MTQVTTRVWVIKDGDGVVLNTFIGEADDTWIGREFDGSIVASVEQMPNQVSGSNPSMEDIVRATRNRLLSTTDYVVLPDNPYSDATQIAYRTYRQALRDIPEQLGFPETVVWPELPTN